jgi:hypothetical protein
LVVEAADFTAAAAAAVVEPVVAFSREKEID